MRFRPRFTMRTLATVVTLVCTYFGAWEATKRYGVPDPQYASSPMPFVVAMLEIKPPPETSYWPQPFDGIVWTYYIWLLGPTIKLPFESKWMK